MSNDGRTYDVVPNHDITAVPIAIDGAGLTEGGHLVLQMDCLCGCGKSLSYVVDAETFAFLAESIPRLWAERCGKVN